MKTETKRVLVSLTLWMTAFILTAGIAVYQRMTGPTFPVRQTEVLKGKEVKYFFFRSFTAHTPLPVKVTAADQSVKAFLNYRRYPTDKTWTEVELVRDQDALKGVIPGQPPAGKVEYSVRVNIEGENILLHQGKSIVARFKGKVPTLFLIIHIIFMFASIMFAVRTGMEVFRKEGNFRWMVYWTLAITFIGGMILGPIVQKYAFGDFWTGFPLGSDLTDNKILVAVIFWVVALFLQKRSKWWVMAAVVIMLAMYLIPHSVLGSELDYQTGKMKNKFTVIVTGKIIETRT